MNSTLVLALLAILFFVLAFATKRRFGILGLALFAGSYLAHSWTGVAMPFVEQSGVDLTALGISTSAFIGIVFTIGPSLLLLANSPKYTGKWTKVLGSIGYAALASVLLVPLLGGVIVDDASTPVTNFVTMNYTVLVTVGLVASIVDLFLSRAPKPHKGKSGKHGH